MVVVRNGRSLFGLLTLKSAALSQEWIDDEMRWFFSSWYKFKKVNSYFDNYWVGIVKDGWGLIDHGTFKSGVSHKWFDELSSLIGWFFYVYSDGIIFGLMTNLLCIFYVQMLGGTLQLYIAGVFEKNSLWAIVTPK